MKDMKKNRKNKISAMLAAVMLCTGFTYCVDINVCAEEPEEAPLILLLDEEIEGFDSTKQNEGSNEEDTGNVNQLENIAIKDGLTYFGTQGYSSTKAEKAFDGLYDTNWQAGSSYGKAPGKNVGVDAGEGNVLVFNKAVIYENDSKGEYRVTEFELQVSDDMTSWRKIAGGETIGENPAVLEFDTVSVRAARFYIVSTIGDYKMPLIAEMELYREISSSTAISSEVYKIDSEKKEIVINEGDKVSDLVETIAAPYGGSIQFYDENGVLENNASLTPKCTAVVTAEDGTTTEIYTIKFYTIEPGTNIATVKGMKYIGNGGFSSTGPEKAFDGDYTTSWQTHATPGAGKRVGIDAGEGKSITFNTVRLFEAADGNGIYRTTGFQIQITNDDPGSSGNEGNWTTVAEGGKIVDGQVEMVFKTQVARAVRFYAVSTEPAEKVSIIREMEIYFIPSTDTKITSEKFYIDDDKAVIYIPEGTTAGALNAGITLPLDATAQITDSYGAVISGTRKVEKGSSFTVTAQDEVSTAAYTICYESEIIELIKAKTTVDEFI